jgi:hypothetical protein
MHKHRDQANCGIKVEFIGDDGRKVSSEIVEVLLPSRSSLSTAAAHTRGFVREAQLGAHPPIQQAGHAQSRVEKSQTLDSLTIPMPRK